MKIQLQAVATFLVKYEIIPKVDEDTIIQLLTKSGEEISSMYKLDDRKFNANIISMFKSPRILHLSDWWYDLGEEDVDYGYKDALSLPDKVNTSIPAGNQKNQIMANCNNATITLGYKDLVTGQKFPVRYGLNTINHLATKIQSPRIYAELVDKGDDFALYVAVTRDRLDDFESEINELFAAPSLTHSQKETENQIIKQAYST